jgi:hypothetical protein
MTHPLTKTARRGYLANLFTLPPLVYPFQYNPAQLTDTKEVEWATRTPLPVDRGIGGIGAMFAAGQAEGGLGGAEKMAGMSREVGGRVFSRAELKQFSRERERTVSFSFPIDGRERRPGEPGLRRNDEGDVLADLAVLRSFVYPRNADWLEIAKLVRAGGTKDAFTKLWFDEPPTAVLVLGDMSMEGFVTSLKITETLFNEHLNPVRAQVDITMIEKIDSVSFILDSLKRVVRTVAASAYDDLPRVVF